MDDSPAPPRALFRVARWAVVVLPLITVLLVVTGPLDPRVGLAVGLSMEILLAGVLIAEAMAFRRAYRRGRSANAGRWAAVPAGLAAALPAPVAWSCARRPASFGRCGGRYAAAAPSNQATSCCRTPTGSASCCGRRLASA